MRADGLVALIPARGGSKRVPGKNIREFGNHPLIAYTIAAALDSGVFADTIVSTDDERTAEIAQQYGAEVPFLRPATMARDSSPDIEWVEFTLSELTRAGRDYESFAILRPTSPFRQAQTILRAWGQFKERRDADSLRAVEKCRQHPGKMWVIEGDTMRPLLQGGPKSPPWHSTPYQALPPVYAQNASLEIAWTRVIRETHTIAGERVVPFVSQGHEGFDINDPYDWWLAEELLRRGEAPLPVVSRPIRTV
jgi:CMP-N,N'-diacetyllegionaminic acid synthase